MKKITLLVAVLAIMGFTFTSCDKNEEKCWKVVVTTYIEGDKSVSTTYTWATEAQVEANIQLIKAGFNQEYRDNKHKIYVHKSLAKKHGTGEDCYDRNY